MNQKEPCQGTYSAQQAGNVVTITAEDSHPTGGYVVELDRDQIFMFPPQWTLYHTAPPGFVNMLVTPFSVTTQFHAEGTVTEVMIADKIGRHVVQVVQKAAAAAAAAAGCGDLASISGYTNACTYNVVIQPDGSATAGICFKTHALAEKQEFPAGTIDTKSLLSLLTQIGDVSKIPTETTEISYAGKTSGNLQSIQRQASGGDQALLQASEDLAKFLQATLNQLKIS